MLERLMVFIFGEVCEKCGTRALHRGYWTRGHNHMCEQATGDDGTRCFECGDIVWDRTFEEYKKALPRWCEAHEDN